MSKEKPAGHRLTRENIASGEIRRLIEQHDPNVRIVSDEEHRASIAATLAAHPEGGKGSRDVWLFAYGSLIWNPMIHVDSKTLAAVHGYHRSFCLWTHLTRGSREVPGLVLGLDRGGACRGVVYRVAASEAQHELELLWRREMINASYAPRWLQTVDDKGKRRWAIAFVINRAHEHYAASLTENQVVDSIAHAKGALGPCAHYLFDTADHLEALGIRDRQISRLRDRVRQVIESQKKTAD